MGSDTNFIKEAKLFLPSTRKRLRGIREKQSEQPTTVPEDMGRIIKKFWGGLWEKDDTEQTCPKMERYLRRTYPKRLDNELLIKPSIELITNTILDSNNSSSGPDGIPFSVYRELVDIVSPCLLELTEHILNGGELPPDFNLGLLHLIPKTDTMLVADTTPITVNNAGNRLIAATIVKCITPAWDKMLDPAQKLSIKGRIMTDHVRDINEEYYA